MPNLVVSCVRLSILDCLPSLYLLGLSFYYISSTWALECDKFYETYHIYVQILVALCCRMTLISQVVNFTLY